MGYQESVDPAAEQAAQQLVEEELRQNPGAPPRLPEAPRDDEEFDRYTAAPAELDARPPDAYDAADDSSDDSYAAA